MIKSTPYKNITKMGLTPNHPFNFQDVVFKVNVAQEVNNAQNAPTKKPYI